MKLAILRAYDYFREHRKVYFLSITLITISLLLLLSKQTYREDITDFLPLNSQYQKAMRVYQDISGSNRLFVIIQHKDSINADPDEVVNAIQDYENFLRSIDDGNFVKDLTTQIDYEALSEVTTFIYDNIPYFLTEEDYLRMDSALAIPGYITQQLAIDKERMIFPTSSLFLEGIKHDPLNLFTPVVEKLQNQSVDVNYELYDGYIFTPDMSRGLIMLTSSFGSSETENNSKLLSLLNRAGNSTMAVHKNIEIRVWGGPAIAVTNANQIKSDSLASSSIAVFLIILLLLFCFRNVRNILLIVFSIAWGWLFAMGMLALINNNMSVIVIGISSVILGIAVNYPLHLISHLNHTPNIRNALKEIATPLFIGNITTVGAFFTLVPLDSNALRDLGLFSSFLLIGTIFFVLFSLPHVVKLSLNNKKDVFMSFVGDVKLENYTWLSIVVLILTVIFGYYGYNTSFDTNMNHINYMTEEQKSDMEYMQTMISTQSDLQELYIVSEGTSFNDAFNENQRTHNLIQDLFNDGMIARYSSCFPFLSSEEEQLRRLNNWSDFLARNRDIINTVDDEAHKEGFAENVFSGFTDVIHRSYLPQDLSFFEPLYSVLFSNNVSVDYQQNSYSVIDHVFVEPVYSNKVKDEIGSSDNRYVFNAASLNTSIATSLSDDFNYIGWACALIVFFFLWFSFGSIELALLSFLPMAVSWIWILGIMSILEIKFNLVNIILATFIFGQGDDYTIFITEGCQYEYAYRKKMIASYKKSIIISALIMFIGIGALIFAKHPALHSLAEVTIVGMFSVVLMAYLLPPLVFKWLVSYKGNYRVRPLSFRMLLPHRDRENSYDSLVVDRYRYKGNELFSCVKKRMKLYNNYNQWINQEESSTVIVVNNAYGEFSLSMALAHPEKRIYAFELEEEMILAATYSAEGIANNIFVRTKSEIDIIDLIDKEESLTLYIINPSDEDIINYSKYNPVIITK